MPATEDLGARVVGLVEDAVRDSPQNLLNGFDGEPAWGVPRVGFAAGDDPLFEFLKEDIGEFYWTPAEAFEMHTGDTIDPALLSVVSWVIPQTAATLADQRSEKRFPAERWMKSRAYWPELTRDVHARVCAGLEALEVRAIPPETGGFWSTETSERYGFASRWSQRHTAFVAGLGTFGLSEGLITPAGVAMRAGSVIAEGRLDPTVREHDDHHAWCPYFVDGSCGECMKRCPAGAITASGHDKIKCERYMATVVSPRTRESVGDRTAGCGLCQSGVQCEAGIPGSIVSRKSGSAQTTTD